ncbi:MAG: bifunctional DNA-formamidopyrimidine glycosylase/DNA-(apurinic or apyrimidinic site) lyase [Planktomarina sp.]|uniref:bifunctional DNA-formamidopyrimidine glycosylase/DNA-(apurinic or apyrimidinic site) lyase n=1 Tax=Planktomarina sp. TaxID=2024851 RepID=UPI00326043E0|nr:bifunctional DNA-formamidopyrimidine glycosylase/DNA-(apurinic or apyrimidinic site) lyase [Planktomarina sp.]
MPELPEVETVRRGLQPAMQDQKIMRAEVNRPDLRWPFPLDMAQRLTGARVLRLWRRSKYILLDLDTQETLIVHLGMSGRMLVSGQQIGEFYQDHPAPEKHDHVVFHMENETRVTFNDARRFGAMDLAPTAEVEMHKMLSSLGPEPLSNYLDDTYLAAALAGRNTPIKSALLDQRLIAGLGNIYVCEVLFRAKISPMRRAKDLSKSQVGSLVPIIRTVLEEAIEAGGSSLKDYRQTGGELGYFQHSFHVYDRESEPCKHAGCGGTIARVSQSGRSSFYCPTCQR